MQDEALPEWIVSHGGAWHSALKLSYTEGWGYHLITQQDVMPQESAPTEVLACPYELCMTKELNEAIIRNVQSLTQSKTSSPPLEGRDFEVLDERRKLAICLVLHMLFIVDQSRLPLGSSQYLSHLPYVRALPSSPPATPLYFTPEERALLAGTNLGFAADEKEAGWRTEWGTISETLLAIGVTNTSKEHESDCQKYILANTWITSRAFPSSLVDGDNTKIINPSQQFSTSAPHEPSASQHPTQASSETSYPILIPGIDLFNHRRGEPVTWISRQKPSQCSTEHTAGIVSLAPTSRSSSHTSGCRGEVVLALRRKISAGEQVFNNYGPKGNEELILAYGFSIPRNPGDTVPVKLGSTNLAPDVASTLSDLGLKVDALHLLTIDGYIPTTLAQTVRVCLGSLANHADGITLEEMIQGLENEDDTVEERIACEMDCWGMLEDLLSNKLSKAVEFSRRIEVSREQAGIRDSVWRTCQDYADGQIRILERTVSALQTKIDTMEQSLPGEE